MMLRKLLVLVVGISLFGCGSNGPSIVGNWAGSSKGVDIKFTAKSDSTFTLEGATDLHGRWETSGSEVRLYRDVRNGGDVGFGEGGDGTIIFQVSKDGKELIGNSGGGSSFTLTRK